MAPRRQQEIFQATLEILVEKGYERLTIEGVAERAEVNKTTIYRWWPSKAALLGAVLVEAHLLDLSAPDTGSLRGDLEAVVAGMAALLTKPPMAGVTVAMLGATVHNAELAASTQRFFADRFAKEKPIFERAIQRGELARDVDPMLIIDMLAGAVWVRAVFRALPLDDSFAAEAVDVALTGIAARQPARQN